MASDAPRALRLTTQVVVGLAVVGFGLLLTARNLGWVAEHQVRDVMRLWPLVFVGIGVLKMVQATCASSRVFAGLLIGVGAWLTAEEFYNVPYHFWDWWPLLLIAMGVLLITRATQGSSAAVPVIADQSSSEFAFWSGIQRRISSPNFAHANLTAIMGGIEIDLRNAGAANGHAVIEVFAMWGGIDIKVSPDWRVSNEVTAIMGGAVDNSTGTQAARNHLTIRGVVFMGGVEIKT